MAVCGCVWRGMAWCGCGVAVAGSDRPVSHHVALERAAEVIPIYIPSLIGQYPYLFVDPANRLHCTLLLDIADCREVINKLIAEFGRLWSVRQIVVS